VGGIVALWGGSKICGLQGRYDWGKKLREWVGVLKTYLAKHKSLPGFLGDNILLSSQWRDQEARREHDGKS